MTTSAPKIKLYTNHACPWAHRAHIALSELKLPFEEEIIDLSKPRTQEYLAVNPRGLVPSMAFDDEIILESAIVSSFLADAFPSHLVPASNDPNGPLTRSKITFFVDTYFSKVNGFLYKMQNAQTDEEAESFANEYVNGIVKEMEPLLKDAGPYFNGSDQLTLAEVLTGSFVLRVFTLPKYGVLPQSILNGLSSKAPNFYRWGQAVSKHPSVTGIYDEKSIAERTKAKMPPTRFS